MGRPTKHLDERSTEVFVPAVRRLIERRLAEVAGSLLRAEGLRQLMPGKMLRTRLAARLAESCASGPGPEVMERACAATEMVHTATLCHDDVIDGALIRRGRPTLWRETGPSCAVLVGDILLCEAIDLVSGADGDRYVKTFVAKTREVCTAEAEQELLLRGGPLDVETCLRIARGKTGPLFAFAARVCAGEDTSFAAALEEVGYMVGTAYQIADDVVDVSGEEMVSGKTLGTDSKRGKFTLAHLPQGGRRLALEHVSSLCVSAAERLGSRRRG